MLISRISVDNKDGQLPLISVKALRSGDPAQVQSVADAIGEAARTIGFFRICDHGIDTALIADVYRVAEQFFGLQDDFKQQYYIAKSTNHRGYVPFTEKGDYPDEVNRSYEAFDLGLDLPHNDPDYCAGNRVLGPNVWPMLAGFQDTVAQYYREVSALGRLICSSLEGHLGLPAGAMTGHMNKPISQLRLLHYVRQAQTVAHKSVNMGAHTDYECLTLLHTRNQGLQVMTQDDKWIDVPVDPDVLIVNIGDMMEAWTNGIFRSTPHRVLNLSPERYSLPYFVATNYDTLIKPFSQLIGAGQSAKYEPFFAGAHLERMLVRDFPYLRNRPKSPQAGAAGLPEDVVYNPFEGRLKQGAS
ncbi:isopenicillin N synthase family dioxygenase [Sulfitobacter guttiformis]|uniref:2-oxoglutarate-dependent ethylene/succinate-forming enzyme n=1 Tax=Sulfitobacter guttiformis TaxID=74349 RepID=J7FXQ2_9RHOB|nr:2-oxoglutarate and iron-dependent oxygenase domain-containing protein [Sulfitobacter guttiformis]AFP55400.1 oxidoreductase, 2OG-Fe(II) oxygenase family [Sulfitobacter guttiformis]KIN75556.1 Oxidoreductase, 2OG-Fe(II) oxygenase family [Sulfitobacter guttiformis KCTC 32187]RKE91033.1 isopenicillin N synthase-like dioxygenase [Sulfitobacter guttiformis]